MPVIFDLSQPIEPGMPVYPGDPVPAVEPAAPEGGPWRVSSLRLGTHTGTHLDAPSHFVQRGRTVDQLPLERFLLPGICIHLEGLRPNQPIDAGRLAGRLAPIPEHGAVLIHTGWDRLWSQVGYFEHPYLTARAARLLARSGIGLVGIDAPSVDSSARGTSAAHAVLLGREILILENLRGLEQLPEGQPFQLAALPLRLTGLDGSPVRAVAWEGDPHLAP